MVIGSVLADFDGTACAVDVASELCKRFAAPGWERLDDAVGNDELTLREAIDSQTSMLQASRDEMLRFVLDNFTVAPSFVTLARWAQTADAAVAVVSDGFGFYIASMLAQAGLGGVPIVANRLVEDALGKRLMHPRAHPDCVTCGTCKIQAIRRYRRRGPVAFVGEGASDRYAAMFADVVFAKDRLAYLCERDGVDYVPWSTFDDVRDALESGASLPRGPQPAICPGWRQAVSGRHQQASTSSVR